MLNWRERLGCGVGMLSVIYLKHVGMLKKISGGMRVEEITKKKREN